MSVSKKIFGVIAICLILVAGVWICQAVSTAWNYSETYKANQKQMEQDKLEKDLNKYKSMGTKTEIAQIGEWNFVNILFL